MCPPLELTSIVSPCQHSSIVMPRKRTEHGEVLDCESPKWIADKENSPLGECCQQTRVRRRRRIPAIFMIICIGKTVSEQRLAETGADMDQGSIQFQLAPAGLWTLLWSDCM